MDTTSCPQCGTATDAGRCPRCAGLRADLDQLIAELATLDQRDLRLRQEYAALTRRRHQVQQRIAALQAELARPAPSPAPTSSAPASPGSPLPPLFPNAPAPAPSAPPSGVPNFEAISETLQRLAESASRLEAEMKEDDDGDEVMEKLLKEFEGNAGARLLQSCYSLLILFFHRV